MRRKSIIKSPKWIRNKHQLGKNASIKSLRRYCKEIWSEFIKERDGHKCIFCGETKYLNAHHIISAKCLHTKFIPECGISVCAKHHMLGRVSAHGSPWIIYEWLKLNRPNQHKWFVDNRESVRIDNPKQSKEDYRLILKDLLDRFEEEYPQVIARSHYYTFSEEEETEIIDYYLKDNKASLTSTATQFECGEGIIKGIFKRHKIEIRRNPGKHKIW